MDIPEGGAPQADGVQTEQQRIEAEAVERHRKSLPGYEDPNPDVVEGHNPDGTPVTPEDSIPEKYKGKSIEEVIAMHQEAEKKIGQPTPTPNPEPTPPAEGAQAEPTPSQEGEATGFTKYTNEYAETGEVSEASYKELESKGFSRGDVDAYIEGQKAIGASFSAKIYEMTGGEEGYNDLITWAQEGIDAGTIADYNEALTRGDKDKVTRLIDYMALKRGSANPTPNRVQGESGSDAGGLKVFANKLEWQVATNPRTTPYGKDKKYTEMVDNRYLKSKRQGTL